MSAHQDQQYIQALLDNDHTGVATIYSRFAVRIERFVCANSGSADDARDIFQEGLIAITRRARQTEFVLTCPFEAYLYMVCRGKWLNELKRRKRAQVTISETEGFTEKTTAHKLADTTLLEEGRNELFLRYFDKLSENCRALLKLSWSGISMDEVSSHLDITYGYARKRKSECIAQLTKWIQAAPEFATLT
jgi:RNA polymerase sigma factor (sigma-70 family)